MKKYLIIVFLVLASASYGQPPRIDSMSVDESKSELQIHGDFGGAKGKVWIDSIESTIKSWSDSYIVVKIPDTGKGSTGGVIVGGRGYLSKIKVLSCLKGSVSFGYNNSTQGKGDYKNFILNIAFRVELSSILKQSQAIANLSLMKTSVLEINAGHAWWDFHGNGEDWNVHQARVLPVPNDSIYNIGYQAKCSLIIDSGILIIDVRNVKGVLEDHAIIKNSIYNVVDRNNYKVDNFIFQFLCDFEFSISKIIGFSSVTPLPVTNFTPIAISFPLPITVLMLGRRPALLSPVNFSLFSYRNFIELVWDSLSFMTSYHLQASTDSLFSTRPVDTTISALSLSLPPLAGLSKYFWRVAGVNSEGESRWSDVWNFTTGSKADVKAKNNSALTLSSYPNPSSNELNISYSLPENGYARIILYNLQGNVIRENIANGSENQLKWNISDLPNGSYILGLISDKRQKTEIIKIVH